MRKWLIILALVGATYFLFFRSPGTQGLLSKVGPTDGGGGEVIKNAGGDDFDVHDLIVPGHITVVEFYTDTCPGCRKLRADLHRFLPLRRDIAVKMVRMPNDWNVPWAKREFHLNIHFTPFIQIYDAKGGLVVGDDGDDDDANHALYDLMNATLRKQWEKEHNSA